MMDIARTLIERAKEATGELRDAARLARVIDFRQRDPLVMVIQAALDEYEKAAARIAAVEQERDRYIAALKQAHDVLASCDAILDPEEHPDLQAEVSAILVPCDDHCPTLPTERKS